VAIPSGDSASQRPCTAPAEASERVRPVGYRWRVTPTDDRVQVADGVFLHVRRWPGEGRPFLLVHGLSSNARLWDGVATELSAAGHPVHAVDLRSHGDSDAPPDGYDTATAADDLTALGLTGTIAVGQSWGGNVVITLAAKHPEVVAALGLVDGGWFDPAREFPSWEAAERALRPPDIDGRPAEDLRRYLSQAHPDWSAEAVEATLHNMRIEPDGTVSRRLPIDRHMQIVRSMWDDPPHRYYASVAVPVLLIPAGRTARAREAAAALADATLREYPGADHDLHAQRPREVAAHLLDLARRVDA
jgi:non-heme chloroperoxidase